MKFITKLRRNEKGATAIEYGLIAALIAVAAIVAMQNLGGQVTKTFEKVETGMKNEPKKEGV
jgi:pilus assembly protein Flp/PilA